jgi:CelD/BcsL family acetyltransferase involved in cellulose biosynthesis
MDYQKQIRRSGILLGWIPSVDPDVANLDPGDRLFGIPKALIIEGLLEDLDTYESLREIHCE